MAFHTPEAPPQAADSDWYAAAGHLIAYEEIALLMSIRGGTWTSRTVADATGFAQQLVSVAYLPRLHRHGLLEDVGPAPSGRRGVRPHQYVLTPGADYLLREHAEAKRDRIARALDAMGLSRMLLASDIPPTHVKLYRRISTVTEEELCTEAAHGGLYLTKAAHSLGFSDSTIRDNLRDLTAADILAGAGAITTPHGHIVDTYEFPEGIDEWVGSAMVRKEAILAELEAA